MNFLKLFVYFKLFGHEIVLAQSIDLSLFNPCSVYLSFKPNLDLEQRNKLLFKFSKWPVQFQAISTKSEFYNFDFKVSRRIKTHCFLIVNINDSQADKLIFNWKFNPETTFLRRTTRILVYLNPSQANCYYGDGKAGSTTDQNSTFIISFSAERIGYFAVHSVLLLAGLFILIAIE